MEPTSAQPPSVEAFAGYVLHAMRTVYEELGPAASGYMNFYEVRILENHRPFSGYDRWVADYVAKTWPNRRILDVGSGIGTLEMLIARHGLGVGGIEMDPGRSKSARRLREELAKTWPEIAKNWQVIEGLFPDAIEGTSFQGKDTVVIFTNVGGTWEDALFERILGALPKFQHAMLDLYRFGGQRNEIAQRNELLNRIASGARNVQHVQPKGWTNYDFVQFDF